MDIVLITQLVILFVLLALSAFFSSSETSLFSLSSAQLQQMRRDRNPRLGLIEELLSEPRRLIATILIGNEFVNVSASVLSATIIIGLFGSANSWLNVVIMVPILLLFGEITPKTLAYANNVAFATVQSRYIQIFARFISPLRKVVRLVSEFFIKLIVKGERANSNLLTEDMVRSLTNAAVGEGSLDTKESDYIHQIFDFGNKTVGDLMTYRSQMVAVDDSMSFAEILKVIKDNRHTKVPVFSKVDQTVAGVLYARDVLAMDISADIPYIGNLVKEKLREPYLVPASRGATDLFVAMRKRRISLALVTDEFGGIVGLITLEDLLQCIFGELPSWSDSLFKDSVFLDRLGKGRYRASGSLPIQQFNTIAGTQLDANGVTTVAGLLLRTHGEIPKKGEVIAVENVTFTVSEVTKQRIVSVDAQISHQSTDEIQLTNGQGG